MTAAIGQPLSRVDGHAKVTGTARYAAEFDLPGLAHAALALSTIARGRITRIDTAAAEAADGVIAVLTHENAPRLPYRPMAERPAVDPDAGEQLHLLQGAEIVFAGQPIAVVVAETPEAAGHAAALIAVDYEAAQAQTVFAPHAGAADSPPQETRRGDAEAAFAEAAVTVDAVYEHPRMHHNAIEPHATIAAWQGDRLTLYDKTQWVGNDRHEIAHVFAIPEADIRVVSPFVGGAFGSALRTWPHVAAAALAARVAGRPVRLELTRRELYTQIGFRPATWQRVRLGADRDGRLTAIIHEAVSQTSTYEDYTETTTAPARNTYACPNVLTRYGLARLNTSTPCPMRAPGAVSGLFALEAAMDELAAELGMDPVALRLVNHADRDENEGLEWSSKALKECYRTAAERFGWDARNQGIGAMRDGHELIGYGMASTVYHAGRAPASASATLYANGTALVQSAASDMGPGTYTAITQIAADALGLPPEDVRFELGDTDLPAAPVHGGSITAASVGNAAHAACRAVLDRLVERATGGGPGGGTGGGTGGGRGPLADCPADEIEARGGGLGRRGERTTVPYAEILRAHGLDSLEARAESAPGDEQSRYSSAAFGAVFVEVRVDEALGTVRVARVAGAYDIGRVINPKIARSQCIGGVMGGIGMALFEEAEWDPRLGRVMNANLAEYLVPVCADTGEITVDFVGEADTRFNPLGVKGVAELAICGVAPAVLAAIHHATGRRLRSLPVTPEKILA